MIQKMIRNQQQEHVAGLIKSELFPFKESKKRSSSKNISIFMQYSATWSRKSFPSSRSSICAGFAHYSSAFTGLFRALW